MINKIVRLYSNEIQLGVQKQITDFQIEPKRLVLLVAIIDGLLTNIIKYTYLSRDTGLIHISINKAKQNITPSYRTMELVLQKIMILKIIKHLI
jgi:two-component sensor histidine kinase